MGSFIYGVLFVILITQNNPRFSVNAIECFHFTWSGRNITKDKCNGTLLDFYGKPQPCKLPFNITKNGKPPNLTELAGNNTYRRVCPQEQCLKYSWLDVNGNLQNYSLFCGKAIDVTNPSKEGGQAVTNGCWEEKVSTFTREVCVCNDYDLCNGSSALSVAVLVDAMIFFASLTVLAHSLGFLQ